MTPRKAHKRARRDINRSRSLKMPLERGINRRADAFRRGIKSGSLTAPGDNRWTKLYLKHCKKLIKIMMKNTDKLHEKTNDNPKRLD